METAIPTARELAHYFLAVQHPETRQWIADEVRLDLLTEELSEDVMLATDMETAAVRARRFAPGQPAEALLNRWVAASTDLQAMLSMRFEGGDPRKPFVDASILSRPLAAEDLPALAAAASRAYAVLGPRYLRLWSAEPPYRFAGTQPDRRFVAAPISAAAEGIGTSIPAELSLVRVDSVRNYAAARAAYEAVDREHPAHVRQARISDYADLVGSAKAGNLFEITVNGTWAGYVALKSTVSLGMPVYRIRELILAARFRGSGYRARLPALLARVLPDKTRVLMGTIHADNRGAQQAAAASGRIDIGGWFQVKVP